jgi:PTH1 family peptidyl-tRNA hydrolase
MSQKRVFLIIGLGNPGKRYGNTRHNAGFMVIDEIADAFSIPIDKKKFDVVFGRGKIDSHDVILAKPMAFMNKSGPPTLNLASYFSIPCEDLLVIHDDIDLTYERIKIKSKGGHAGHNGIRSLIDAFGNGDFDRIRIGIGRPQAQNGVSSHVLGKFSAVEAKNFDRIVKRARDAAVTVICSGVREGMDKFN